MNARKRNITLLSLYLLIAMAFIPILQYTLSIGMYSPNQTQKPADFYLIIFSCGPALIIMGTGLVSYFKSLTTKFMGVFCIISGVFWSVLIFMALAAEQG